MSVFNAVAPPLPKTSHAYVTGDTFSTNFPTTSGAFQTTYGGGMGDAFVAKIGATIRDQILLVLSFHLASGTTNSLVAKLRNAQTSVDAGNLTAASNQLDAFMNEVEAQSGKKIPKDEANELIGVAKEVKAGLGGP